MSRLRRYAHDRLQGDRLQLAPGVGPLHASPVGTEFVLHRDGCFQTTLIYIPPGTSVPVHRHNRFASLDLALAGAGALAIAGSIAFFGQATSGPLVANLVPVAKGAWHSGYTATGALYLSFQEWGGEPSFATLDWESQ